MAELVGKPRVGRHVRQHPRAAEEARVRGDEEQPRFGGQNHTQPDLIEPWPEAKALENAPEDDGVEGLAVDRRGVPQQIEQDDAAGGESQRRGHVEHRQLPGANDGLAQRLHVVRHRFDPGVGTAAQRVRTQEQRQRGDPADVVRELARVLDRVGHDARQAFRMSEDPVGDQDHVCDDEAEENRQQHADRFLHAAQIEHQQCRDERELRAELERTKRSGQQAE